MARLRILLRICSRLERYHSRRAGTILKCSKDPHSSGFFKLAAGSTFEKGYRAFTATRSSDQFLSSDIPTRGGFLFKGLNLLKFRKSFITRPHIN